jgi:lactate permease
LRGNAMWQQVCDPFGNSMLSTIAAAIPVVTLLVLIATGAVKTHLAALIALLVVIIIAVLLFTMPAGLAIRASILGAVIGFFPIGWIVLNVIFMHRLTVATGAFATLQQAIGGVTPDRPLAAGAADRLRFWRVLRGRFGFGTPVAVTAAILIGRVFTADGAGPVVDRQYCARSLRRARHADRGPRKRDRARPFSARRDGRSQLRSSPVS